MALYPYFPYLSSDLADIQYKRSERVCDFHEKRHSESRALLAGRREILMSLYIFFVWFGFKSVFFSVYSLISNQSTTYPVS
jgi:hypothetical protein